MKPANVAAYESLVVTCQVRVSDKTWETNDRLMVWTRSAEGVDTYVLEATASDHSMLRPDRWESIHASIPTDGTATLQVLFGMSSNDAGGEGRAWFDNFVLNAVARAVVVAPDCSAIASCAGRYRCLLDEAAQGCVAMDPSDDSCPTGSTKCEEPPATPAGSWQLSSFLLPPLLAGNIAPDRGYGATVALEEEGERLLVGDLLLERQWKDIAVRSE